MGRREQIISMREKGMTYQEIGDAMGLSRQRVHQIAQHAPMRRVYGPYFKPGPVQRIPYVGLRQWMMANRVSTSELGRRCGRKGLKLDGKHTISVRTANKILAVTGLAYDEAFRRDG